MKIIDNLKCETFGELNRGDVFKTDARYYMRIGDIVTIRGNFNAVSLESGNARNFKDATIVQKVNAAVVIGGEDNGYKYSEEDR